MKIDIAEITDAPADAENPQGFVILHGSLAREGCVMTGAGFGRDPFEAKARVFATEAGAIAAITDGRVASGEAIIIAAADEAEMSAIFAALSSAELKDIALISNGKFAPSTNGITISHVGKSIRYVQNADTITIDIKGRRLNIDADLTIRSGEAPAATVNGGKVKNGFAPLAKYAAMLDSASQAADTAA
ncbi:dihydroxy-acid dehydratase [Asticcacaulis tiandongensis]|uniref:dihydroxy-acid dehydratase domain-containing protein n=1 Tax=Asticcacaulis tiandongensis TaxID=2565365 RepID=UPI001C642B53|nr:dihydroxy-acid dehydratase [Asticcacaulis tiandongensis]